MDNNILFIRVGLSFSRIDLRSNGKISPEEENISSEAFCFIYYA